MTLQSIGGTPVPWPLPGIPRISASDNPSFSSSTMDAVGEMVCMIGRIRFAAGPGTSKTVSSSGGAVQWRSGSVTWAGTSTVRVGIQDASTSAGPPARCVEDWTTGSPPYKDMVRGTDAIASNTWITSSIGTGSRTIAHGDLVAVTWEMTVRGGSDSVTVAGLVGVTSSNANMPLFTAKTSGAWGATVIVPNVVITCDDGTLAFLDGALPCSAVTTRSFANNTGTADEYGNILTPTGKWGTDELWAVVDPDGDFDLVLYSDALNVSAPTIEQTVSVDSNIVSAANNGHFREAVGLETLTAAAAYAVTVRPSSTTAVTMIEISVSAAGHLAGWPGGTGCYKCTRLDASGALATDTAKRMLAGICISQTDDGAGGGSSIGFSPVRMVA